MDTAPNSTQIHLHGVPEHRLAGLYAPANAEFSSRAMAWPSSKPLGAAGGSGRLWLDVDAHWEQGPDGDCDQKCQAYVMVAVLDDRTGAPMPGCAQRRALAIGFPACELAGAAARSV